jgi:hypothetical protein
MGRVIIEGDQIAVVEAVINPIVFQPLNRGMGKRVKRDGRESVEGCLQAPKSRLRRKDEFSRQKGDEHALDPMCDSRDSVASGIGERLHAGWGHPYPAGHRPHRDSGPSPSGTKNIVAIWIVSGEGEVFGMKVVRRFRKMLPNLLIPSVGEVSPLTLSPQTYREE